MTGTEGFARFSGSVSRAAGRPVVFVTAVGLVILWAVTGPVFGFSETWQLVINTGTTIITSWWYSSCKTLRTVMGPHSGKAGRTNSCQCRHQPSDRRPSIWLRTNSNIFATSLITPPNGIMRS